MSCVDLGDLPSRLTGATLAVAFQKIWQFGAEGATVQMRIPHPRHDSFLIDLGYVQALLPETFMQLDQRHSKTGLANQLRVNFEVVETAFVLDPYWQAAVNEGQASVEDIQLISRQASNVIEWIDIQLRVNKSLWVEAGATKLDPEMRRQLQEQLQGHVDRGDEQAANVIRKFLENASVGEKVTK